MVVLKLICPRMHLTETELIRPEAQPDGTVQGLAGSAADFCGVCDSAGVVVLEAVEVAS
jgi:hypothetical protein